jgi:hypothetical protein
MDTDIMHEIGKNPKLNSRSTIAALAADLELATETINKTPIKAGGDIDQSPDAASLPDLAAQIADDLRLLGHEDSLDEGVLRCERLWTFVLKSRKRRPRASTIFASRHR